MTESITISNVDQLQENIPEVMSRLTHMHRIPQVRQMQLLTRLRLARNFPSTAQRRKCVMARLQAISILGEKLDTFPCLPIGCMPLKLYATSEWPTRNMNIHLLMRCGETNQPIVWVQSSWFDVCSLWDSFLEL